MLLQATIGHEAAISGEDFRLRKRRQKPSLILIPENEFTRFDGGSRSQCWLKATAFNGQLRDLVPISEMVVRVSKRSNGSHIEVRETPNSGKLREICLMLL